MTGLILAAGLGMRLNGKNSICKPLQKVGGIPLIAHSLKLLDEAGIEKAVVVVGKYYEEIRNEIGNRLGNVVIEYAIQKEQKGLVNAILCGCEKCDGDVTVMLADELFVKAKLSECIDLFEKESLDFVATYVSEDDPERIKANFSIRTSDHGTPTDFVEKPIEVINSMKGTGVCVFSAKSLDILRRNYDEKQNFPNTLCDFFNMLLEMKMNAAVFEFADIEVNVNTSEDLKRAKSLFETKE